MTERNAATAYVTNINSGHHYEGLARYGAMRPITSGNYAIYKNTRLLEEVVEALRLSEETDYLAFSGAAFVGAMCLAVWLTMHKQCNALLYDPRQDNYVLRILKRSDIIIQIEKQRDADEKRKRA